MEQVSLAIVGATGAVGTSIREILEERNFPINEIFLLGSERSAGERLQYNGRTIKVTQVEDFNFGKVEIAIFSAGGSVSKEYAPKAAKTGAIVIDNTAEFRYEKDVPLVVSEVNPDAIEGYRSRGIIANPNCSTMQMMVALKPIYDAVGIKHINVSTYQAVSGSGKEAIEELAKQTAQLLNAQDVKTKVYDKQIAFNVLPNIDVMQDNGYTKEEMKMVWETHKILDDDSIKVSPTAVRVPVFYGHSEAIHLQTVKPIDAQTVKQLMEQAPGIELIDDMSELEYATPVTHASGKDAVFVSRIRNDIGLDNGIAMWVVSDNVRKGAALNSVQIAEILVREYL